jgi:hypothetical protein
VIVSMVPATARHASLLAPNLRASTVAGIEASCGFEPIDALIASMRVSASAFTLMFDNGPAMIWGLREMGDGVARLWMMTGRLVDRAPIAFVKACKRALAPVLRDYSMVFSIIDARDAQLLRLSEAMGFTVAATEPHGVQGLPFHRIEARRRAHV